MNEEQTAAVVDLIQKVYAGENTQAGQSFSDMMLDRINNRLADMKVDVAKSMFSQDATIGEEPEEEETVYLSQDEYDSLPDEEKEGWDKLPEEIAVEEETDLQELSPGLLKKASDIRRHQAGEHQARVATAANRGLDGDRYREHYKAATVLSKKRTDLDNHREKKISDRAVKYAKRVKEETIKEYSRGLWRPPTGMNKSTGVEKGPGKVIAGPKAAAPAPKPVKTAKPKKAAVAKPVKAVKPAKPTK